MNKAPEKTVKAGAAGRRIGAEIAAPGLARGVVYLAPRPRWQRIAEERRPIEDERQSLNLAMEEATAELMDLIARSDETGGEILAFQIAMLADPELVAPALEAIEGGERAALAFAAALDLQIADYKAAEDDYFRARAEDLVDLRDRVLTSLGGGEIAEEDAPPGAIYVAEELTPSRFLDIDWSTASGVALTGGSANSHVALLARSRGVPFLINLENAPEDRDAGVEAVIDAESGCLVLQPAEDELNHYRTRITEQTERRKAEQALLNEPAMTADGTRITLLLNVDDPSVLEGIEAGHCDGVGLTRTEFLFGEGGLPDEERQYRIYRALLFWADGRPVTIRTLDAGADKPIPEVTPENEANPFLGVRGLRLSLIRPEIFRVQLRALARAACHGTLKVMVPMVTAPEEMEQAQNLMMEEVETLKAEGKKAEMPAFGMMVETPAAALAASAFKAEFFSLGTNDLVQYVMAASRDSKGLKHLQDPQNPAVLELIGRVCRAGKEQDKDVSVCGEMAGQPEHLAALLKAGVRTLSVAPAALGPVKAALRELRVEDNE